MSSVAAMWGCVVFALLSRSANADIMVTQEGMPEPIVVKTRSDPLDFGEVAHWHIEHPIFSDVTKTSYHSKKVSLKTGEAIFTLPTVNVLPFPSPGKAYAILAGEFDIIEAQTGRSVPLNEMYSHHWLIYDKLVGGNGFDIGCGGHDAFVSNVFGAGGEMRGIDYTYPAGMGYVSTTGDQHWSANIHFIRTEDLSTEHFNGDHGAAVKSCIECEYAPGKGVSCIPGLDGNAIFGCCFDGCRCPVNTKDKSTKDYYLAYNITWTTELDKVKPIHVYVIDGFNCGITENLKPNMKKGNRVCSDKECFTTVTRQIPESGTIHWAYTHQHSGGINSTLLINGKPHCSSYPHYGTDPHNTPGNEKGYAVGFKMCIDPKDPSGAVHVNKGDSLTVEAFYSVDAEDKRALPIPGGSHTGTMNLHYFFVNPDEAPAPPSPSPSAKYICSNDKCVQSSGGLPLATCQAACGGNDGMVV